MRWIASLALLFCTLPALANALPTDPAKSAPADPFLWLENVNSARSMAWVKAQNAKTLAVLRADPRYAMLDAQILAIAQATDRIPIPTQLAGQIYNFWQESGHPRGIWRRTSLASYRTTHPIWQTVLDVDALAAAEHSNLVYKGADCREPAETDCLISFSDGGEDAVTTREFDLATSAFVPGGFTIPRAKAAAGWVSPQELLVATDWGPGSLTRSGYPFIVKRLRRGQKLAAAVEIFRGQPTDVGVDILALTDGQGNPVTLLQRELDAFSARFYRLDAGGVTQMRFPAKSTVDGLLNNQILVKADEPTHGAPAGSLLAFDARDLAKAPTVIFAPGPRQDLEAVAVTKNHAVAEIYDNVRGRIFQFTPKGGGWTGEKLALPDNNSTSLISSDLANDQVFVDVTGFLTPGSIWLADLAGSAPPALLKQSPARFDASGQVVEQLEAVSKDGTKIPYFVVHPKTMKADGQNPTLLYAYGGFQISMLPAYSGALGKGWLEHGGVYVLANIRGGGEFGPAWHEAALQTHRQVAYDDFAAVARDLIARHITSPRRLGIEGGSNGGLLMGVAFEQAPKLWHAVVIEVPLLDMLRYEQIAAGASWVGEYGSVSNPVQRAFLASISPYQNLKAGMAYPKPFIFTTTKDDRVSPVHARKFAAKLAALGYPYFYYESTEGGHGAGVNAREIAAEKALEMTYLQELLMQ